MRNDIKRFLIGLINDYEQTVEENTLSLENILDSEDFQKMLSRLNKDEKLEVIQFLEVFFMEMEE